MPNHFERYLERKSWCRHLIERHPLDENFFNSFTYNHVPMTDSSLRSLHRDIKHNAKLDRTMIPMLLFIQAEMDRRNLSELPSR
jgi:hypothetical protein